MDEEEGLYYLAKTKAPLFSPMQIVGFTMWQIKYRLKEYKSVKFEMVGFHFHFNDYQETSHRPICSVTGRGRLFVCDVTQTGIAPVGTYDWNDGLFDVTWAENNENLVVAGAGDGAVLLFDVKNTKVVPIEKIPMQNKDLLNRKIEKIYHCK